MDTPRTKAELAQQLNFTPRMLRDLRYVPDAGRRKTAKLYSDVQLLRHLNRYCPADRRPGLIAALLHRLESHVCPSLREADSARQPYDVIAGRFSDDGIAWTDPGDLKLMIEAAAAQERKDREERKYQDSVNLAERATEHWVSQTVTDVIAGVYQPVLDRVHMQTRDLFHRLPAYHELALETAELSSADRAHRIGTWIQERSDQLAEMIADSVESAMPELRRQLYDKLTER